MSPSPAGTGLVPLSLLGSPSTSSLGGSCSSRCLCVLGTATPEGLQARRAAGWEHGLGGGGGPEAGIIQPLVECQQDDPCLLLGMREVPWQRPVRARCRPHPSHFPNALSTPQTAAQNHLRRPFATQNCVCIPCLQPTGLFLYPQGWEHPQSRCCAFPPTETTRVGRRRLHLTASWVSVQEQGITGLEADYKGGLIARKLKGLWEVNRGKKALG